MPRAPQLDIEVEVVVPGRLVRVRGRLDGSTDCALRDELQRAMVLADGELVLDLAEAEIYDSTALALVVGAHHRARRVGRELVVANGSARFERLVSAMRLGRVLRRVTLDPQDALGLARTAD